MPIYKGIPDLIRACSTIPEADLWLVGTGEVEAEARALVQELGMEDRVKFWGAVEDDLLWRIYQTCDLFCIASTDRTEAFGVVLLEAAHFGKPVVVREIEGSGVAWVAVELCMGRAVQGSNLKGCLAGALCLQ
jgi:glycosyltransferase involved in cell wall biosynthesis